MKKVIFTNILLILFGFSIHSAENNVLTKCKGFWTNGKLNFAKGYFKNTHFSLEELFKQHYKESYVKIKEDLIKVKKGIDQIEAIKHTAPMKDTPQKTQIILKTQSAKPIEIIDFKNRINELHKTAETLGKAMNVLLSATCTIINDSQQESNTSHTHSQEKNTHFNYADFLKKDNVKKNLETFKNELKTLKNELKTLNTKGEELFNYTEFLNAKDEKEYYEKLDLQELIEEVVTALKEIKVEEVKGGGIEMKN